MERQQLRGYAVSALLLGVLLCFLLVTGAHSDARLEEFNARFNNSAAANWYTCYSSPRFEVKPGKDTERGAAWGYFDDGIETKGYGVLSIIASPNSNDYDQVGCAGYLEGVLTAVRIRQMYKNYVVGMFPNDTIFNEAYKFAEASMRWTTAQVQANRKAPGADGQYWNQVGLIMTQLSAMTEGYNSVSSTQQKLPATALFILNMAGDMDDLLPALERKTLKSQGLPTVDFRDDESGIMEALVHSHCSAIVKPNAARTELFVAHEMWSSYSQLMGVYKSYAFNLKAAGTASQRVSFSSYPGFLSSEDDFYITDTNLVVMETTNSIYNLTLYDVVKPETLMSWIRVIVSNRMASTGEQWVQIMPKYNSGTYNNQWMVVDYKRFRPGQSKLASGTLWIGSQLPGYFESADVTEVINTQGYWPSYNIPYFKDIFAKAGYPELVKKHGDIFTYENCPRAKIFRQRHDQVQDVKSLQKFMRYNNFEHDPLSLGCPYYQIASRGDLAPTNPPIQFCSRQPFGAINTKLTVSNWVAKQQASIVGGPTHDSLPPFEWTPAIEKAFPRASHEGQPKKFDFDWFMVSFPKDQ